MGELRGDGTQVQYAYGPEGVAAQRTLLGGASQGMLYPLLDAQASVRALTDASGAVVRRVTYDAWGGVRQTTGAAWTRLGYTGEPMGSHDGTVYLRARHYQPTLGRFLQRDTFPGIPERPQSLHTYLYAENNPATFSDPSGQVVFIPVLLAVWAIAEVAIQIYDTYDTLDTVFDPCVSLWEKGFVGTLYVGGLFLPGGGYGTGGRAVLRHGDEAYRFVRWGDEAADGARLLENGDDLARHSDDAEQIRVLGGSASRGPWLQRIDLRIDANESRIYFQYSDYDDEAVQLARSVPQEGQFFDVFIHSDGVNFQVATGEYSRGNVPFEIVADEILQANVHKRRIRLFACKASLCSDGPAQQLSDQLNVQLKASSEDVNLYLNGEIKPDPENWDRIRPRQK